MAGTTHGVGFGGKAPTTVTHTFSLNGADPDFKATGLRYSSYIVDDLTQDVKLDYFDDAKFWGRATGHFKKRVEDWYGLPIK